MAEAIGLEFTKADPTQTNFLWPKVESLLPKPPATILEVGCGNGAFAERLSSLGYVVTGIDASKSGIRIARSAHPLVRFDCRSAYGNFQSLGDDFDAILSIEVIEHLTDPRAFLSNAYNALKPSGSIILSTPFHGYWKNLTLSVFNKWDAHFGVDWHGGHIKFFSESSLSSMLHSVGFDQISFHNAGRIPYLWKSMVCKAVR